MVDVLDDSNRNFHNKSFESLDLSVCKEDSIAKVICHTPRSVKKKLLQRFEFFINFHIILWDLAIALQK